MQEYASEVDYELFERKFWPKFCSREVTSKHVTPAIAWTEIFSVIKGSYNSSEFASKALSKELYVNSATYRRTILDMPEKDAIYRIYMKYEAWKQ